MATSTEKRRSIAPSRSSRLLNSSSSSGAPEPKIVPTRWEKLIANQPCIVFSGTLFATFALIGALVAAGFPKFSNGGFSALNSRTQLRIDAMDELTTMGRASIRAKDNSKTLCRERYQHPGQKPGQQQDECDAQPDNASRAECRARYMAECNADAACFALNPSYFTYDVYDASGQKTGQKQGLNYFQCSPIALARRLGASDSDYQQRDLLAAPDRKQCVQDKVDQGGERQWTIYYEAEVTGDNLLTEASLLAICEFERTTLMEKGLRRYCRANEFCACPLDGDTRPGATFFPPMCAAAATNCANVVGSDPPAALSLSLPANPKTATIALFTSDAARCELVPDWREKLKILASVDGSEQAWADAHAGGARDIANQVKNYVDTVFDRDFYATYNATGGASTTSLYLRSVLALAEPVGGSGDFTADVLPGLLDDLKNVAGPGVRFYYRDDDFMQKQMFKDLRFAGVSIVFVLLYLWFKTTSFFLAAIGILEMLLSIPLAFFVWRALLGRGYFVFLQVRYLCPLLAAADESWRFLFFFLRLTHSLTRSSTLFLQMMVIFIILGIGADDIFVLMDAYKQSKAQPSYISGSTETRFAWAYRRASNAMTVTSFTTFMAFVAAGMTPVPAIQAFGIIAAFVVLFDFLLVITLFAAAMMMYEKWGFCCSSSSDAAGGGGSGSGCCLVSYCCDRPPPPAEGDHKELDVEALGSAERFFFNHAGVLQRFAKPILALFLAISAASGYLYMAVLKPATRLGDFFPAESPATRLARLTEDGFKSTASDQKFAIDVVWGLDLDAPLDRTGIDGLAPQSRSGGDTPSDAPQPKVIFDASWATDAKQVQMQLEMAQVCENAYAYAPRFVTDAPSLVAAHENATSFAPIAEQYCWAAELKEYRTATGRAWPIPNGTDLVIDLTVEGCDMWRALGKAHDASDPSDCGFKEWLRAKGKRMVAEGSPISTQYTQETQKGGFNIAVDGATGRQYVRVAWQSFNSTMRWGRDPPTDMLKLQFDDWSAFLQEQGVSAFKSHRVFGWLETVTALTDSANKGILGSLGLAWVVLILSSSNFLISVMAMSSIVGIMLTCFGVMALLGWTISILESICMIIVVGMAVDYTVHLMHSYNEAGAPDRFGKAQTALAEMGVSVVGGAITTLVACLPLLMAQFKFFTQFGSFIAIITFCSILWAIFYLMTLAMAVGPEGQEHLWCDIVAVKYWLRCKKAPPPAQSRLIMDNGAGIEMGATSVAQSAQSGDKKATEPAEAIVL